MVHTILLKILNESSCHLTHDFLADWFCACNFTDRITIEKCLTEV